MTTPPTGWSDVPIRELMLGLPDGKLVHQGWSPQCESGPALSDLEWGALKTTAIQDGAYLPEHNKRLPDSLEPKERLEVKPGDLLMTCAGPRVRCGVACLVRDTPPKRFISGKMYRFRANEALVDPRLLEAFLRTPATKAQIDAMKTGISESGMNITHEKFSQLVVPVAPLAEQKRIADKLDTVLTRVDAVNTRLARVAPLLKRFRQSVLAAATSGRLTGDWRDADPTTPAWSQTTVGAIATDLRYGTSKKCSVEPFGSAVLRIPNIGSDGGPELNDLKYAEFDLAEQAKLALRAGDLLIIRSNGSVDLVGKCCVVNEQAAGMLFAGYLMRLRMDAARALPKFVYLALSSPSLRALIERTAKSTSGVNNINSEELRSLPVHLPPLEEQAEIVRRVETLFALADRLEARLRAAQTATERLTPSLLAKAFRGELVPQDPSDEPASELLKRLASSAETSATKRARRGRSA